MTSILNPLRAGAAWAGMALVLVLHPMMAAGGEKDSAAPGAAWEQIPADATTPPLTVAQLLGEFDKAAAAGGKLRSWEARCRVTSQQDTSQWDRPSGPSGRSKPVVISYSIHLVSNGARWFSERRSGGWEEEDTESRTCCDGREVQIADASGRGMNIYAQDGFAQVTGAARTRLELPIGFPPFLDTTPQGGLVPESLLDMRKILTDPSAKVSPWRTRVGDRVCYVVERATTTEIPIFRSIEELRAWEKEHPDRPSGVSPFVVPEAKPGAKQTVAETIRLALDPASGFMPARWVCKHKTSVSGVPGIDQAQSASQEIVCTDFRKFGAGGHVAGRFQYGSYVDDPQGKPRAVVQQEVVLEEFKTDQEYPAGLFHVDPPEGCNVLDWARGIQYRSGDLEATLAELLAAVDLRKAFHEGLKEKPAPSLEGAAWPNSKPIRLEDARGKPVRLVFWSMGCPSSLSRLPQLQREWEFAQKSGDATVYVSVHPYVDGRELQQLKDLLRQQQITFPVMVDAREPRNRAWGATFARYRVYHAWCEFSIDGTGRVTNHHGGEQILMNQSNWWVKHLREGGQP